MWETHTQYFVLITFSYIQRRIKCHTSKIIRRRGENKEEVDKSERKKYFPVICLLKPGLVFSFGEEENLLGKALTCSNRENRGKLGGGEQYCPRTTRGVVLTSSFGEHPKTVMARIPLEVPSV